MHIVLWIVGIINLILGIFVLSRNIHNKANIIYAFFSFGISIWSIGLGLEYYGLFVEQVFSKDFILWMNRIFYFGISFTSLWVYLLSWYFPNDDKITKKIVTFFVTTSLIASVVAFMVPLSISDDLKVNYYQPLEIIFSCHFVLLVLIGLIRFYKKYKKSNDQIEKHKILILFVAVAIASVFGTVTNSIIPAFFQNISLAYIGPLGSFFMVVMIGYAILKYRFFDIKVVLGKSFAVVTVLFIYTIAALILGLSVSGITEVGLNQQTLIIILFLILLIIFTVRPLKKSLDKLFLKEYYDLSVQIEKLKSEFEAESTLEKLAIRVAQKSRDVLEIEDVYFFVFNQKKEKYITQFPRYGEVIFSPEDMLIKAFVAAKKTIVEKEIDYLNQESPERKELYREARKIMRKLNIEVLISLSLGGKYLGALGFGKQINRKLYSPDKIEKLEDFAKKLSVALAGVVEYEETVERIKGIVTN